MAIAEPSTAELIEQAAKLSKYRYLLPQVSPQLAAMAQSSVSDQPPAAAVSPLEEVLAAPGELPPELAVLMPTIWEPLDAGAARDRAVACLLGLAIGDAVGAAVEFKARGSFPSQTDMTGGGPFNLKAGEWTDDTTMALCLGESLLAIGEMNQSDFMTRLRNWVENGHNSVNGRCFDIGRTTKAAVERFIATGEPSQGTGEDVTSGNGSLPRVVPVAIYYAGRSDEA